MTKKFQAATAADLVIGKEIWYKHDRRKCRITAIYRGQAELEVVNPTAFPHGFHLVALHELKVPIVKKARSTA